MARLLDFARFAFLAERKAVEINAKRAFYHQKRVKIIDFGPTSSLILKLLFYHILSVFSAPKKAYPIVDMLDHVSFKTFKYHVFLSIFKVLNITWPNMSTMGSALLGAGQHDKIRIFHTCLQNEHF